MVTDLRKQQYYFFFFVTVYLATGVGALTLGHAWLSQLGSGAPREAVVSRAIEQAGMIIGGVVTGAALLGMTGGMFPIKRKELLMAFAVMLVITMIAELGLGGAIWFRTLRMRSVFETQWINDWSDALKITFQDTPLDGYPQCCGYLDNENAVLSGACATVPSTFPGCESKIATFAVGYLGRLFTTLFGFTVVNLFSFVSTVILIMTRNDEERYIRIGKKEGRSYTNVI